ncbi:sugar ABC transporter ATP-binding protein [Frondihabitans sp. VKM Ac-2883]|uniref:sugar ABC transporter ATP-binding protein n=1 Tax=Frondihabitans sp. VKM Ac-2883 TaxID=2783823 RepID=UPI00188BA814|nr:sugar ABC transporter ATP-binding protein [Frondihabitans sp. VKM Ac-2883]MBF4577539.1 sugar ABC transporter ATP-binding protein [Frondihabitans sp. VKM Ac-2883]
MSIRQPEGQAVLQLTDVSKAFGAVQALNGVSLKLVPGQVHCLAGENGAGKSTLIKILTGAEHRDTGEFTVDGENLTVATPGSLRAAGVQAVYQELSLLPHLSVSENMFMGRLPARSGIIRAHELKSRCRTVLDDLGLDDVDPDVIVERLSAATKQLVEVAKVTTAEQVKVIVFDEPTTALTEAESERLLQQIQRFKADGIAILYVTHRLEEMFTIGDWVTVLRDGEVSQSGPLSDYTEATLINAMVGREVSSLYPDEPRQIKDARLSVRGLRRTPESPAVNFDAQAGEILGIGGLLGSGRSELLLSIFGSEPVADGTISIDGKNVRPDGPRTMMDAGVALLTEDRKVLGLLPDLSVRENVTIASLRKGSRRGLLPGKSQAREADALLDSLRLRAGSYDQPVSTLSGGNQQKVLLARWLLTKPKVIMFDEPTKGIDVGAKGELYDVINDLARQGLAVIVVSSYLPELLGLADRILVLREEAIAGELPGGATEEQVLQLASGGAGATSEHFESTPPVHHNPDIRQNIED